MRSAEVDHSHEIKHQELRLASYTKFQLTLIDKFYEFSILSLIFRRFDEILIKILAFSAVATDICNRR